MSIARMSLIEIIAPRPHTSDLIACIQDFGSLQLEEVPLIVPGTRSYLHREQLTNEQSREIKKLKEVLHVLSDLNVAIKDEPPPDPRAEEEARETLRSEGGEYLLLHTSRLKRKVDSLLRRRANIASDIRSLDNYRRRLDQLAPLLADAAVSATTTHLALLVAPGDRHQFGVMSQRLSDLTQDNSRILQAERGAKDARTTDVVLLTFPAEYTGAVRLLIEQTGLAELRLPREVRDLPLTEAVDQLQQQRRDLPEKLKVIERDLAAFREKNTAVIAVIDKICADTLGRLEALQAMARSDMIVVAHAWVPSEELPAFESSVQQHLGEATVVCEFEAMAGQTSRVPVRLENTRFFRPFEHLLSLFSVPLYGSFDPTPIMALVFPLFFGLVLGDIAYGLVLLGLSLWARRRWRHNPVARDVTVMATWCAGASILFGVIFGEFLGDLGHRTELIPVTIGGTTLIPVWQSRELIINELLILTILIGFLHIVFGLLLGVFESVRMRERRHLLESLGLLVGLLGLVVLLIPVEVAWLPAAVRKPAGSIAICAAIITLIVNNGVTGPIELVSLVANILSYCRLMALGVAGMVLANLANSLGASQRSLVFGVLVALPIHILAVALGILEPTIHALRLHYVEFLPKFFIGDGRLYTPLRRKGKEQ